MQSFKAVLFDLDGTLINTLTDLANATNYMLEQFGFPTHEVEKYKYMVGNGMPKLMERALPNGHKDEQSIKEALNIFLPYYNAHSLDNTAPYNEIMQLLCELKNRNIKTAVVTNKAHLSAVSLVEKLFLNMFSGVAGQKDGMPTKPNPTVVFNVMNELGVQPNECIFVGDSGVDMQTAKNSGAFALGVLWGFREKDELIKNGADDVIASPLELLKFINN